MTCIPKLSASVTLAWNWDLGRCIEAWQRAGLAAIGVTRHGLEEYGRERGIRELKASGLAIANYQGAPIYNLVDPTRATARRDRALAALDDAAELGADCIYVATGGRGMRTWEDAAQIVVEQTHAILPEIHARNLQLALEPVHPLRQDLTFLNTAEDTDEIVQRIDDHAVGYVFDLWHLWWGRHAEAVADRSAGTRVFSVQVSDHKAETMRTLDRAMPGEGIMPLARLLGALRAGGYERWWDLEVISPDNESMSHGDLTGYEAALHRAIDGFRRVWDTITTS